MDDNDGDDFDSKKIWRKTLYVSLLLLLLCSFDDSVVSNIHPSNDFLSSLLNLVH